MSSQSSSTFTLAAGSVAVLMAAGLGYLSWNAAKAPSTTSKSSALTEIGDIDDDDKQDDGDYIQPDEVIQVFERLFQEVQGIFAQLMQQIQQLQRAGQQIPPAQLQALLKGELERALTVRQQVALQQADLDYDCLEEATWEFLEQGHPGVTNAVNRFQKLWENCTGQPVSGWRKGQAPMGGEAKGDAPGEPLSPEDTLKAAESYFNSLTQAMRDLVASYKAQGKNLQEPLVQNQLNMEFSGVANEAGVKALQESHGISLATFEASIQAHAQNPTVARALAVMQMKQQQELQGIGSGAN